MKKGKMLLKYLLFIKTISWVVSNMSIYIMFICLFFHFRNTYLISTSLDE